MLQQWPDTGAIDIDEVTVTYKGINCFGKTDGPGTDEVYATIGTIAVTGGPDQPVETSTIRTKLYTDVDNGSSVPDNIVLYKGKPFGLNISFLLLEHDQGDPNKYYDAVKSSVQTAAGALTTAIGGAFGPVAAGVAGPVLYELVPAVSKGINDLLGTGDDLIGNVTIPLTAKQVIVFAARTREFTEKQINYKLPTQLLNGDGSSYKGYFTFDKA